MLHADDSAPTPTVSRAACGRAHRHAALTEAALALALIAAGCRVSQYDRGSDAAWRAKLDAADPSVRAEAAYALSVLGDTTPATIERLGRLLADSGAEVRMEATAALVELGRRGGRVVPVAVRAVSSPLPARTRILAATVLGALGSAARGAAPALITTAATRGDDSGTVALRGAALAALGDIGDPSPATLRAVSGGTRDGDAEVRAAALEALGRLAIGGDTASQRLATHALADPAPLVREHAAYLAAAVGASAHGIVALERAADDSTPLVRRAAVEALGRLARRGPVPPSARSTLTRALRDTSVAVRSAASEALRGMGRP